MKRDEITARDCCMSQESFLKLKAIGDAKRKTLRYKIRAAIPWQLKPYLSCYRVNRRRRLKIHRLRKFYVCRDTFEYFLLLEFCWVHVTLTWRPETL